MLPPHARRGVPTPGTRVPAYRRLAADLAARIHAGELSDGQRLPTEAELIQAHQLSRQTVRRAYQELVADGIVERTPRRGTFPARRSPYRRTFGSIDELLGLSIDTELEVVEAIELISEPTVASGLGLQFDDVLHVGYRRLHQDLPFCYTDVYLPPRLEPLLTTATYLRQPSSRRRTTVLSLLDAKLPTPIAGARQTVTAIASPPHIADQIDCYEGEPILKITRVHFDADGRPVELCMNYFNPERYSYTLQLKRDGREPEHTAN